MRASRISALWRSIVPWNPATAWMLCASSVVYVTAGISHGWDSGFRGAMATFLAWAIVREIAPRRALASALAPFAAVAFAIPAETDLLACTGVLFAARVAARSVGDPPTWFDGALLIGMCAWLAMRPEALPTALVLAAITFAAAPPDRLRATGVLALAGALLIGSIEGTLTIRPEWSAPAIPAQVLLACCVAASMALLAWPLPDRLRVRDDRRRGALRGRRIRIARLATIAPVLATVVWIGSDAPFVLASASAALLAAGIGGLGARAASDTLA